MSDQRRLNISPTPRLDLAIAVLGTILTCAWWVARVAVRAMLWVCAFAVGFVIAYRAVRR